MIRLSFVYAPRPLSFSLYSQPLVHYSPQRHAIMKRMWKDIHLYIMYNYYERITCITHVIHSIQLLELASENVKINSQITCHNLCKQDTCHVLTFSTNWMFDSIRKSLIILFILMSVPLVSSTRVWTCFSISAVRVLTCFENSLRNNNIWREGGEGGGGGRGREERKKGRVNVHVNVLIV